MNPEAINAVVLDDALGPPGPGSIVSADKNKWIDFVCSSQAAQRALEGTFSSTKATDIDELLSNIIGNLSHISTLWEHYTAGRLLEASLDQLFETFHLEWKGKAEKPLEVIEALNALPGVSHVGKYWRIEDAKDAIKNADIVFIDFFLDDNESIDDAMQRIRNYKECLKSAKLLFFMSSRASIETQQNVRDLIGMRTAFFEVMTKRQIEKARVLKNIEAKCSAYPVNIRLERVVRDLACATRSAATEFERQCDCLEVHDLQLLNLARLEKEGESLSSYLTWLASEAIAAKIRRIAGDSLNNPPIDLGKIGVSGQIKQGKVLFDLFSEVVFSPGHKRDEPVHFGELFTPKKNRRQKLFGHAQSRTPSIAVSSYGKRLSIQRLGARQSFPMKIPGRNGRVNENLPDYILVISPACDLLRCEPSKKVLCVAGIAEDFSDIRTQTKEKLFGKHDLGLRHLLEDRDASYLITWQADKVFTIPAEKLLSGEFNRRAQMNEIYAQEVKEEVLRELGRVGTQIDPPPTYALHATLRWKVGEDWHEAETEKDEFYAAVITYSEQSKDKTPAVVLSDAFKAWANEKVSSSFDGKDLPAKIANALGAIGSSSQFKLGANLATRKDSLIVRVSNETNGEAKGVLVDVALCV